MNLSKPLQKHFRQLFFFGIGAATSFLFNFGLTFLLVEVFNFSEIPAIAIASFFFYSYAFVFNSLVTFKSSISWLKILKYLFVLALAYTLNLLFSYLLLDFVDIPGFLANWIKITWLMDLIFSYYYLLAMFISMSAVMMLKYLIYNYWVFAEKDTFSDSRNTPHTPTSKNTSSKTSSNTQTSSFSSEKSSSPLPSRRGNASIAQAEIILEIDYLDHKGFGIAKLNAKKWRVLNALPGEKVQLIEYKKGRKPKGIAGEILQKSEFRVKPKDPESFIATSPFQILNLNQENQIKKQNIKNYFQNLADINLPKFEIYSPQKENSYHYRNKVEFSFYGFDETEEISLAFFKRGSSKGKIPVQGSSLIQPKMNQVANKIAQFLNTKKITARNLKSLILRYSEFEKKVIAGLFVKDLGLDFKQQELENLLDQDLKGLAWIYSKPQSPASVVTKIEHQVGDLILQEKVLDTVLNYDLTQFFQVNIPAFEQVILDLRKFLEKEKGFSKNLLDMYAGVGTIGLCLRDYFDQIKAVELSEKSQIFGYKNATANNLSESFEFIQASSESSLQAINSQQTLILDPPRTGLHPDLIQTVLTQKPPLIFYLSCNPETQVRDINLLKQAYQIQFFKAYNFYPHTPHCESLAVLT